MGLSFNQSLDIESERSLLERKILILAGDTDSNLGDLAILTAMCERIEEFIPNSRISILTSCPDRDRTRLGILPIARGWHGLAGLFDAARHADLVICGGGGLFQDDDSLIKMPYWALRLFLVRLLSGPVRGLSIGAGPLDHWASRIFARLALQQLDSVSVRDPLAKSVLAPLTQKSVDVVPDPAFLLRAAPESEARAVLRNSGVLTDDAAPLLGVAIRRWFHKHSSLIPYKYASRLGLGKIRGQQEMSTFINLISTTLDDVARRTKAKVVFMPTYNVEHEADIEVCRAVASRMEAKNSTILEIDDPCLYKAVTGQLSAMLCGRMHPAILASAQQTPIVGLAYNPKFIGTFSLLGLESRCMAMDDFVERESSEKLTEMLEAAIREPSQNRVSTSVIETRIGDYIENLVAPIPV